MIDVVKQVLIKCGSNIPLGTKENCTEVFDFTCEKFSQEQIQGIINGLEDDSEAIYGIFLKSNNDIVKLKAIKKIHDSDFLKEIVLGVCDCGNFVKMKAIEQIEDKELLKELLKVKAIYERSCFLYKLSEKFEDKDLYEIITSDSYDIRAKLFFVSRIKDRKYLEKLIKELNDKELVEKSKYFLEHLV